MNSLNSASLEMNSALISKQGDPEKPRLNFDCRAQARRSEDWVARRIIEALERIFANGIPS